MRKYFSEKNKLGITLVHQPQGVGVLVSRSTPSPQDPSAAGLKLSLPSGQSSLPHLVQCVGQEHCQAFEIALGQPYAILQRIPPRLG